MKTGKTPIPILAILMPLLACMNLQATTYEVGLTKPLTAIGQVSWESLQAGDTVLIYWRATPYKEKWVTCRQGTQAAVGLYNFTVRAAESQAIPANDTQDLSLCGTR
jgi:hypothetical protein